MHFRTRCVVLVLLALFLGGVARASTNGSISGLVTDPSGAVVPGAQITALETQTGIREVTKTDSKGYYSFPVLPIGAYEVEVRVDRFKTFRQINIVIDANSAVKVDATLQVGSATEEVDVRADAVQVETQSTQMGEVISSQRITEVPLNGRAYTDLLSLQPGVVPAAYAGQANGLSGRAPSGGLNAGNQSVDGQRETSNGFMVNGANVEEGRNNGASVVPNLDSISEFRIITNNFDAEYGNFSGGQINVATKSGTNAIHGTGFEFLRNTALNTRNYFNPAPNPKGAFNQNQFGGTVGAPIKKDKAFFFVDYQGTRQTVGQTINTSVPTAVDQTGDITDLVGKLTGSVAGAAMAQKLSSAFGTTVTVGEPYYSGPNCTNCVFSNPQILTNSTILSQLSAPSAKILSGGYIPKGDGQGHLNTSAYSATLNDDKGGIRVDGNTRFGLLSAYYFMDNYSSDSPYPSGGATVPGFDALNIGRAQLANLGDTKSFGASSFNEFHLSYARDAIQDGQPHGGSGPSLQSLGFTTPNCTSSSSASCQYNGGISEVSSSLQGVPNISFNSYTIGIPGNTVHQYNNTFHVSDAFSRILGTHNLKFGVDFHYSQIDQRNYYGEDGSFAFYGGETGSDFVDFLIGAPSSFVQASAQLLDSRSKYLGMFAQDSWRVKPNLTFNYGLRYEISPPWYDTQNKTETIIPGEQSVVFPGAPEGWVVPGDPGVPRGLAPTKYTAFSPRVGLAYSPTAKTSIRAGFGMYYTSVEDLSQFMESGDAPYGIYWGSPAPPFFAAPYMSRANGSIETLSGTNPFPFQYPPPNVSASNPDTTFPWASVEPISYGFSFSPKNRMPYSEHFELSIQRQISSMTVLSASYVGNEGHRLITSVEANPGSAALCAFLSGSNLAPGANACGPWGENNQYQLAPGVTPPSNINVFYAPGSSNTLAGTRTVLNPTYFGTNPYMQETANSNYHSLQASLKHNSNRGEILASYTLAKCIDNSSGLADSTDPFNPKSSRGLCLFNVHQNFVASYNLNFQLEKLLHADQGIAKYFAAGWSLSGITSFVTGLPVNLVEDDDNSEYGTFSVFVDKPQLAGAGKIFPGGGVTSKNPRQGLPYFNNCIASIGGCKANPYFDYEPIGKVGNANRRSFSGPGLDNWNMALLKNTKFRGSTSLQLRFEAFNAWNHAQFQVPWGNIYSSNFGMVTGAADPRLMQVAAKFLF